MFVDYCYISVMSRSYTFSSYGHLEIALVIVEQKALSKLQILSDTCRCALIQFESRQLSLAASKAKLREKLKLQYSTVSFTIFTTMFL